MDAFLIGLLTAQLSLLPVPSQNVYHSLGTNHNGCFRHEKKMSLVILICLVPNHIIIDKSSTFSTNLCCPWNAQQSPSVNKIMGDEMAVSMM